MRARAWRPAGGGGRGPGAAPTAPSPAPCTGRRRRRARRQFFPTGRRSATTRRWSTGSSQGVPRAGPATVWMRMRHPLVAGEQPRRCSASSSSPTPATGSAPRSTGTATSSSTSTSPSTCTACRPASGSAWTPSRSPSRRAWDRRHRAVRRTGADRPGRADAPVRRAGGSTRFRPPMSSTDGHPCGPDVVPGTGHSLRRGSHQTPPLRQGNPRAACRSHRPRRRPRCGPQRAAACCSTPSQISRS